MIMANTKTSEKKTVRVKLFKGKGYEAPVQVWLNGVRYSVPRGKEVEVPLGVAEIIEHSQAQKNEEMLYLSKEND